VGRLEVILLDTHIWIWWVQGDPMPDGMRSARLPGKFHRDPADQIIVATSRVLNLPLATCDEKIRAYPYVRILDGMMIHDR
jgi:PIN domain nuclease of toxin-antitoxin system